MNQEFIYTGNWCINNTFNCIRGDSKNCYNVEHIIDLHVEFKNSSCKSIIGNLVMSCGTWNQQLGSLSISLVGGYAANINEKKLVYSNARMEMVRNAIIKCNPECVLTIAENTKSIKQLTNKDISIIIFALIGILICFIIYYKSIIKPTHISPELVYATV